MAIRMSSKMGTYMHNTMCYDMPIVSSGLVHVDSVQLSCAALWKISNSMLLAGIIVLRTTVVSFFLLAFSFLSSSAIPIRSIPSVVIVEADRIGRLEESDKRTCHAVVDVRIWNEAVEGAHGDVILRLVGLNSHNDPVARLP